MHKSFFSILAVPLILATLYLTLGCTSRGAEPTVGPGTNISVEYLAQARKYRDEGRYDLARQSYAQALSTCRNNANLEVIKRELAGCELLIRTMR